MSHPRPETAIAEWQRGEISHITLSIILTNSDPLLLEETLQSSRPTGEVKVQWKEALMACRSSVKGQGDREIALLSGPDITILSNREKTVIYSKSGTKELGMHHASQFLQLARTAVLAELSINEETKKLLQSRQQATGSSLSEIEIMTASKVKINAR